MQDNREFKIHTLDAFLKNSSDIIFVKNLDLVYVAATESFADTVGVQSAQEAIGKTDLDIFDKEFAEKYRADDQEVIQKEKPLCHVLEPLPEREGKKRYSSTSKYPIYDEAGKVIGLYAIARDVTRQLELEQEAKEANAVKTDFLARMSHDMRTPMNGILGLIHLTMQEEISDPVRDNLEKMNLSAKYLLRLINDILDMSKVQSDKIVLRPEVIDSGKIRDGILASVKPMIDKKNITFNVKSNGIGFTSVKADPVRLQQIFSNVLSNAVKFTPPGGKVDALLECVSRDEDSVSVKITVTDTGIGMSEEFLSHLYEAFVQENNEVTMYAGTGLGMPIVKRLVDLMDGEIEVKSCRGLGTEVSIWLRFERAECAGLEEKKFAFKDCSLQGKCVLLCEGYPLNIEITKKLLERKGCQIVSAANGRIGLNSFANSAVGTYDAILMDILMPVMDGLSTTAAIRQLQRQDAADIPIIAMSANTLPEDIQKAKEAGMNDYLAKPIDPKALYQTLAKYFAEPEQA